MGGRGGLPLTGRLGAAAAGSSSAAPRSPSPATAVAARSGFAGFCCSAGAGDGPVCTEPSLSEGPALGTPESCRSPWQARSGLPGPSVRQSWVLAALPSLPTGRPFLRLPPQASPEQGAGPAAAAADGAGSGERRPRGRACTDGPRSPAGLQACQLALSARTVWARCPNSHLARRYGVTDKNPAGDYWKKVPGTVTCLTGRCWALWGSWGAASTGSQAAPVGAEGEAPLPEPLPGSH